MIEVIEEAPEPELQASAEFALGTAASNNHNFKEEVLKTPSTLSALLKVEFSDACPATMVEDLAQS